MVLLIACRVCDSHAMQSHARPYRTWPNLASPCRSRPRPACGPGTRTRECATTAPTPKGPCLALPCPAVPRRARPNRALPCRTEPRLAAHCRTVPCRALGVRSRESNPSEDHHRPIQLSMPCRARPDRATPSLTRPCPAEPCLAMPCARHAPPRLAWKSIAYRGQKHAIRCQMKRNPNSTGQEETPRTLRSGASHGTSHTLTDRNQSCHARNSDDATHSRPGRSAANRSASRDRTIAIVAPENAGTPTTETSNNRDSNRVT